MLFSAALNFVIFVFLNNYFNTNVVEEMQLEYIIINNLLFPFSISITTTFSDISIKVPQTIQM